MLDHDGFFFSRIRVAVLIKPRFLVHEMTQCFLGISHYVSIPFFESAVVQNKSPRLSDGLLQAKYTSAERKAVLLQSEPSQITD